MKADPKAASGRAFVRSLNILLKFARLYGYEHTRTIEQLQTAWQELRAAIPLGTEAGLLLGATNSQLAAASLGGEQDEFKKWLNDPQKLLELIAAAQGAKGGGVAGSGGPAGTEVSAEARSGEGESGTGGGSGSGIGPGLEGSPISQGGSVSAGGIGSGQAAVPVGSFWTSGGNGSVQMSDVVAGLAGGGPGALGGRRGPGRRGIGRGEPSEEEIYAILGALTSSG